MALVRAATVGIVCAIQERPDMKFREFVNQMPRGQSMRAQANELVVNHRRFGISRRVAKRWRARILRNMRGSYTWDNPQHRADMYAKARDALARGDVSNFAKATLGCGNRFRRFCALMAAGWPDEL